MLKVTLSLLLLLLCTSIFFSAHKVIDTQYHSDNNRSETIKQANILPFSYSNDTKLGDKNASQKVNGDTRNSYLDNAEQHTQFRTFTGIWSYIRTRENGTEVIVRDANGTLLYARELEEGIFGNVEMFNYSTVIVNPFAAQPFLWNFITDKIRYLPFLNHHDMIYSHVTDSFLTLQIETKIDTYSYIYDTIVEYNLAGEKLWQFNFSDHISKDIWDGSMINANRDITHANSLDWNVTSGKIWVHLRNTDQFYQINYKTRSIDWVLGKNGNFKLIDYQNRIVQQLFHMAHDIQNIDNHTFLLFDNQYRDATRFDEIRSRLIEISIDFDTMTGKITNEWVAPANIYNSVWGSIEKLPNGNIISSFGFANTPKIIELNMSNGDYSSFRIDSQVYSIAFRYYTPQLIMKKSYNLLSELEQNVVLQIAGSYNWDLFDNFQFRITINNSQIYQSNLEKLINWQPMTFEININQLIEGNYILQIEITSLTGNNSTFSTDLIVKDYFFYIPEILEVELGGSVELIPYGLFRFPVILTIFENNSLYYNQTWMNNAIIFNSLDFGIGNRSIIIFLYNSSNTLNTYQLELLVYPAEVPLITILSDDIFVWGSQIEIVISVEEHSSYYLELTSEGIKWYTGNYDHTIDVISISLPKLFEGYHRFEVRVVDRLDLSTVVMLVFQIIPPNIPIGVINFPETLDWGVTNQLEWEIHGVTDVFLYRNQELLDFQKVSVTRYYYHLNWREDLWQLKNYNLTLVMSNGLTNTSVSQIVKIDVLRPDVFASDIVTTRTSWTSNAAEALKQTDNQYAEIRFGYENGRLTVDIGAKIVNQDGDDLIIHAIGGTYRILVSDNADGTYHNLGLSQGTSSFDIGNLIGIQFISVEYITGQPILLDAVEAIEIQQQQVIEDPVLDKPLQTVKSSVETIAISWNITNYLVVNYTIKLNQKLTEQQIWDRDTINFNLDVENNIDIYIIDIFVTTILGEVFDGQAKIEVANSSNGLLLGLGGGLVIIVGIIILYQSRKK